MKTLHKYKNLFSILLKWLFLGSIVGLIVGSATALLLTVNDYVGDVRKKTEWLFFFLPLGGIVIGYLYMKYGKVLRNRTMNDAAEVNNLVIEGVQGKKQFSAGWGSSSILEPF